MVDKIWYNMEELIGGSEERVLIETQWNVKKETEKKLNIDELSINRNIVECKVPWTTGSDTTSSVLIETQWNVKTEKRMSIWFIKFVLIETQWNVKYSHQKREPKFPTY